MVPRPASRPGSQPPQFPEQVCTVIGIHAKTGKRYSVRMTRLAGEVSPSRLTQVLDAIIIESSDPTLQ